MKLNRGEPDDPHWKKRFSPKEMVAVWLGLGACFVVLGLQEWFDPSQSPFTGRWGWAKALASNAMGHRGPAVLLSGLGAAMVALGCWKLAEYRAGKRD